MEEAETLVDEEEKGGEAVDVLVEEQEADEAAEAAVDVDKGEPHQWQDAARDRQ